MALLLDTDTFSRLLRDDPAVSARWQENRQSVWLSAVTVRKLLKGAIAAIADAESPNSRSRLTVPDTYHLLTGILLRIADLQTLPFDSQAEAIFQSLPKSAHRVGPRDCRIAASAVAHGMTVVTANTRDFERIAEHLPGLSLADWIR